MAKLGNCKTCTGRVSSEAPTCPHCGQPNPYNFDGLDQVRSFIQEGQIVEAIKKLREIDPNLGLKEAKDIVESGRVL